ncbi:MAG: hypothetical protein LBP73_11605 [Clostridiales Family XIII bacterium]|jgi:hypothetical protein|nr:hypothetical protein [Clostridiales Family XIII bacterium]
MRLNIPPDIEAAARKDRIAASELAEAVAHCEGACAKIYDAASDAYTGYHEIGAITLWVCYKTACGEAELLDYCFNRTRITGVSRPVADPDADFGPLLTPIRDRKLLCCRCGIPPEMRKVLFKYMDRGYYATAFACPSCGQVYENKDTIRYRAERVEPLLEGK